MRAMLGVAIAVFLCLAPSVFSQSNDINSQNRTIEVVVSEKAQAEPDIAEVTIGCLTYGQTQDQAYQANLAIADKVIKALLDAGVPKTQIETDSIELSETSGYDVNDQPPAVRKTRQFKAHQSWHVRVAASDAQKIIDLAVQAGANGVEDVSWDVADADALEAKARSAAMERARTTAAEIARSAGGKLGNLLYASNVVNGLMGLLAGRQLQTTEASVSGGGGGLVTPTFTLKLFPKKVEKQATIRAIFALD